MFPNAEEKWIAALSCLRSGLVAIRSRDLFGSGLQKAPGESHSMPRGTDPFVVAPLLISSLECVCHRHCQERLPIALREPRLPLHLQPPRDACSISRRHRPDRAVHNRDRILHQRVWLCEGRKIQILPPQPKYLNKIINLMPRVMRSAHACLRLAVGDCLLHYGNNRFGSCGCVLGCFQFTASPMFIVFVTVTASSAIVVSCPTCGVEPRGRALRRRCGHRVCGRGCSGRTGTRCLCGCGQRTGRPRRPFRPVARARTTGRRA